VPCTQKVINSDLKPELDGEFWRKAPHFPIGGVLMKKFERISRAAAENLRAPAAALQPSGFKTAKEPEKDIGSNFILTKSGIF